MRARWLSTVLPLAIGIAGVWFATQAVAGDGEWRYRVKQGDTLIGVARAWLAAGHGWRDLQRLNEVPQARRLAVGSTLRVPLAWVRPRGLAARVVNTRGEVLLKAPDGSQLTGLGPDQWLQEGDVIRTGADSSVLVEFTDGSSMFVLSGSELKIERLRGSKGAGNARLKLQDGRIETGVTPRRGRGGFEVHTPVAQIGVRGTEFRVASAGQGRRAASEVTAGKVRVASRRGSTLLTAGFGTVVEAGRQPTRPLPLLEAPALADPLPLIARLPARLAWPALAGVAAYRSQVSPSQGGVALIEQLGPTTELALRDLPDGEYRLVVRGIDAAGLEGRDAVRALTVAARPEPPLILAPAPAARVRDERPELAWTPSPEIASYRVQLAREAGFATPLFEVDNVKGGTLRSPRPLDPGDYWWRIASRAPSGKVGPFSDVQALTYRPPPPGVVPEPAEVSGGAIKLRWRAGDPGQTYRLQLARDAAFAEIATEQALEAPNTTLTSPEPGTWFVRVRTIDTDGYEGPWGPAQSVEVPRNWWPLLLFAVPLLLVW